MSGAGTVLLPAVIGLVVGLLAGGFAVGLLLRRRLVVPRPTTEPIDPWLDAELDKAAAELAARRGCPEAAEAIADKLRLMTRLGRRKGWL